MTPKHKKKHISEVKTEFTRDNHPLMQKVLIKVFYDKLQLKKLYRFRLKNIMNLKSIRNSGLGKYVVFNAEAQDDYVEILSFKHEPIEIYFPDITFIPRLSGALRAKGIVLQELEINKRYDVIISFIRQSRYVLDIEHHDLVFSEIEHKITL